MYQTPPPPVPPKIICYCCEGSGTRPLSKGYFATLQAMIKHGKPVRSDDLRTARLDRDNINGRLRTLEKHGLVRRVRKRGHWVYWEPMPVDARPDKEQQAFNEWAGKHNFTAQDRASFRTAWAAAWACATA